MAQSAKQPQTSKADQDRQSVDIDRLIEGLNHSIVADPGNSIAYRSRGLQYGRKGDYDHAIRDFDKAVLLNPNDTRAYALRGMAWQQKNNHSRAIADFDRAIELDLNNASVYATHRQRSVERNSGDSRLSQGSNSKARPTGAFNLLLNPFVLFGVAPNATAKEIKQAYEDAVEDCVASSDELQRAQQILLTPRLRVDAEIGGFLDVAPGLAKQIVSELKRGVTYDDLAQRLVSLHALPRSNLLAHLGSCSAINVNGFLQLLDAQATVAIGALCDAINEVRAEHQLGAMYESRKLSGKYETGR
jgi:tetratricopeptide (TPR) repeat protein